MDINSTGKTNNVYGLFPLGLQINLHVPQTRCDVLVSDQLLHKPVTFLSLQDFSANLGTLELRFKINWHLSM